MKDDVPSWDFFRIELEKNEGSMKKCIIVCSNT